MHRPLFAAAAAALACANAFAQAPTGVTLYGSLDVAVTRRADHVWAIDPQGGNRLGWFGVEDLGSGWAAQFRIEMRFDPDTGLYERSTRPPWQGESTVGLKSPYGTVRLGRAMTAMQWYAGYFDPWALKTVASINLNQMASYFSDPLQGAGAGSVRWGNAVFYDSPRIGGFLAAASITAPEGAYAVHPYSVALQYHKDQVMLFTGVERNTVGSRFAQVAGAYDFGVVRPSLSFARSQSPAGVDGDRTGPAPAGRAIRAVGIAATAPLSSGQLKFGYNFKKFEGQSGKDHQLGLGYKHDLSRRTYLYTDFNGLKPEVGPERKSYDLGIVHIF
jgi:predicted porin